MKITALPLTFIISLFWSVLCAQTPKSATPKELDQLRESYQKARQQALSPIERKYEDALKLMKTKFTREGNLEAAIAVDSELTLLQAASSTPEDASPTPWFIGTWPYTSTHSLDVLKRGDGAMVLNGKINKTLKWILEDENTVILYEGASPDNATFMKRIIRITDTEAKVAPDNTTAKKEPTPKPRN